MSNSDYYRAVLFGAVLGMSFLTLFYMVNTALDTRTQPEKPKSNFEVVDHYKGCDLLKWDNSQLAEYKYVLYCPK
mgnify:CR=1 FL=1|jgi:hypothetical protein